MRVVGLGQPAAGDDGVGIAVLEALEGNPPPGAELRVLTDAAPLVELLDGGPLLLVDAVVGLEPGSLHLLRPEDLGSVRAWSTHGVSVPDAVGLAQVLSGPEATTGLRILGVGIARPEGPSFCLSEAVAEAVPRAVAEVRRLCEEVLHA